MTLDNPATPPTLVKRCLALVGSKNSLANPQSVVFAGIILGLWLTIVIFTATRHEFWRDEVRAWSFVRAATSVVDLYQLIQYEGHPILWYLLLYLGRSIVDTSLVLPIVSITVAFTAVAIFMFFSPFAFWFRCLFIFTALPLYEYSVMARNYGISMLLLFMAAALYRYREKYGLWLALALALLANTNIHSIIFVGLITAMWIWETMVKPRPVSVRRRAYSLLLPLIIIGAGVLLSVSVVMPKENTIVVPAHEGISLSALSQYFLDALFQPHQTFSQMMPTIFPPWWNSVLLYLIVFGLLQCPSLVVAALGGQVAFGILFHAVYHGDYRHQGLFLIFILFLYWLFMAKGLNNGSLTGIRRVSFNIGLYGAVVLLLLWNIALLKITTQIDLSQQRSSSKAFGEYLQASETYRHAIIVSEPDFLVESLPYYVSNPLYLPREHRFGATVAQSTEADYHLSLSGLLSAGQDIQTRYGQPVLIVFGHGDIDRHLAGEKNYLFQKNFTWTVNEFADFNQATSLVTEFNAAYTDENYQVYAIR